MKTRSMLVAFFTIASICGTASAEPPHPGAATAPVVAGPSCPLQADLTDCKTGLTTCQQDQKMILDYVIKQCPAFKGMTPDAVLDHARKGDDLKRHGGGHHGGGRHKPRRPNPTPTASAPAVTILVVVGEHVAFTANADCKNGGYYLPIGFDANGNKQLDADEVVDKLPACKGDKGDPGAQGKPGANAYTSKPERFTSNSACHAGGTRTTLWSDLNGNGKMEKGEKTGESVVCDGKAGSAGRPGANGDTRVQFGFGLRSSAIWSKDRPIGLSAAPEAQLELWLAPTVEFVAGVAWAPDGDRNMVVTGQLRHRALNKHLGLGFGIQYQAWNLEGNKALWQSVMGMGSIQLVLVDSKWVDVSADTGLLLGLDGYDADAQFAIGGTGGFTASLKF